MTRILAGILFVLLIIVGVSIWLGVNTTKKNITPTITPTPAQETRASYTCANNKTIEATFIKGAPITTKAGEPPTPGGSVKLVLSNGRNVTLPQTISADGSRYATKDDSFVFWSKGNGATVLENGTEKNYTDCKVVTPDPGGLPKIYTNGSISYSIRYPTDYTLNTQYVYQALGPGKDIKGVKFTTPQTMTAGTNLSSDTGVSVESLPTSSCSASLFLSGDTKGMMVSDHGKGYSYAALTQGAAGNQYEEHVWAIPDTNPCIAIRYFIHSTNIGNYPSGQVKEFNKTELINTFDKIRETLLLR